MWRVQRFRKLRDRCVMKGELPEMLAAAGKDGLEDSVTALVDHGDPVDRTTGNRLPQSWHLRLPVEYLPALEDIADPGPSGTKAQPDGDVLARAMNEGLGEDCPVRHRAPGCGAGRAHRGRCSPRTRAGPAGTGPSRLSSGRTNGLSRPWNSGAQGLSLERGHVPHAFTREPAKWHGCVGHERPGESENPLDH